MCSSKSDRKLHFFYFALLEILTNKLFESIKCVHSVSQIDRTPIVWSETSHQHERFAECQVKFRLLSIWPIFQRFLTWLKCVPCQWVWQIPFLNIDCGYFWMNVLIGLKLNFVTADCKESLRVTQQKDSKIGACRRIWFWVIILIPQKLKHVFPDVVTNFIFSLVMHHENHDERWFHSGVQFECELPNDMLQFT